MTFLVFVYKRMPSYGVVTNTNIRYNRLLVILYVFSGYSKKWTREEIASYVSIYSGLKYNPSTQSKPFTKLERLGYLETERFGPYGTYRHRLSAKGLKMFEKEGTFEEHEKTLKELFNQIYY